MDFSDIFSGDTWDAISPIIQGGAAIAGGINGMQNAKNFRNAQAGTLANLDQLYSPNSPYAQQLRQTLERRDAAAGRRSQYGPRETELAAKLTQARAGDLLNPQYSALQRGANASPYGALAGALGYLTGGQKGQSNPLVNTASRLDSLRKGYNTLSGLFGPSSTGTASGAFGGGAAGGAGAAGGSEGLGGLSGLSGFAAPLGVFGLGMALAAGGKTSPQEQMANYNTYKNGGVQGYLNANAPQMGFGNSLQAYNPWDAQGNVRPFDQYLADQQRGLSGQFSPEQTGQISDFYNWALQNKDAITSGSQASGYNGNYQAGD